MLTNKITGFSADLLNTVRSILGEAKKCPADCECEKCEAEEMEEGHMPTADEPTDANKKTAQKIRDMMAKEKKPVKEETKEDLPFEGPYRKTGERKDEYGNKVKNVAKHLAKKAMKANEDLEHTNCGTPECCGQCDTPGQIDEISAKTAVNAYAKRNAKAFNDGQYDDEAEKDYNKLDKQGDRIQRKFGDKTVRKAQSAAYKKIFGEEVENLDETAKIVAHLQKRYGDNIRKSHVRSAASDFGVDAAKLAKAVRTKLGKNMLGEEEQIDEISKGTLGRYINKAKDSIDMASYRQGHKEAHGSSSKPLEKKLTKRHKGISTAVNKLTKEASGDQHIEVTHAVTGQKKKVPVHPDNAFKALNHYKSLSSTKSARIVSEESEQIDELSKGTMGRYINKAATKMGSQGVTAGLKIAADEKSSKNFKDMGKREKGIKLAVNKLTKEEQDFIDSLNDADIEQIDEISKGAALKYLSANKKDDAKARETGDYDRMTKRMRGTDMAVRKYTAKPGSKSVRVPATEEVEITEARGRPRKAGAKDFTIHPKTKEKLMHNNPEHMKKIEALQKNKVLEKPKIEAGQHIMNQLQKAKTSMLGGSTIHFTHGDSKHVSGTHAAKLLSKYAGMKPNEKEDFQKKIGHSHEQLMKHV